MYLSLDEACTHVDAAAFRLVAGIYDDTSSQLLASAVSPPVRYAPGPAWYRHPVPSVGHGYLRSACRSVCAMSFCVQHMQGLSKG